MSSFEWPDLSCLASLASDKNLDVRPVLLRVHTDLFVTAPARARDTIEAFEALALGFLPMVDDTTAAVVAQKLAPVRDTPHTIIDALVRRGGDVREAILAGRQDIAHHIDVPAGPLDVEPRSQESQPRAAQRQSFQSMREEDADLAAAWNEYGPLAGPRLRELVDRARERPQLALVLLGRRDLSAADEAVLYLHADNARRAQIRARLEPVVAMAGSRRSLALPARDAVEALLDRARALDTGGFEKQLAQMLRLSPAPVWAFQREPRRELLVLALIAGGVAPEDCIRILLTLHPAVSRSVKTVFDLAQIARNVSRPVARYLVEAVLNVTIEQNREGRYVPAADPSVRPARGSAARPTLAQIRAAVLARRAG